MIKYEEFKQYWIQPNQSFFPNQFPNDKSNPGPETGKLRFQPLISIHPQNKPREEDSIGVLTIPHDLYKKATRKVEQKNWLKYQDYHFKYWYNWEIENSLDIGKIRLWKNKI